MKRRSFLKFLASLPLVGLIPAAAEKVYGRLDTFRFVPTKRPEKWNGVGEAGVMFPMTGEAVDKQPLISMVKRSAKAYLHPGTVYEIRQPISTDFGRRRGIAWYTNPEIARKRVRPEGHEYDNPTVKDGYLLIGVYVA